METEQLKLVEAVAVKKHKIFSKSKPRFLLRSVIAGMFIGFGVIAAYKTGNFFYLEDSPLAYPVAALTFGAAIILVAYGGGDLFTGNTFYFTYAALKKKIRWPDVLRIWTASYFGNLVGAVLFALLVLGTGLFDDGSANGFLLSAAEKKMNAPVMELFFRGILCNWLVSMAFYVPMTQKGDGAKMFTMLLFVFVFFVSGYEHSIANMGTFAVALLIDHPDTITLAGAVRNLIPVTLGNIVGGGLMMAAVYYYLNRPLQGETEMNAESSDLVHIHRSQANL